MKNQLINLAHQISLWRNSTSSKDSKLAVDTKGTKAMDCETAGESFIIKTEVITMECGRTIRWMDTANSIMREAL